MESMSYIKGQLKSIQTDIEYLTIRPYIYGCKWYYRAHQR